MLHRQATSANILQDLGLADLHNFNSVHKTLLWLWESTQGRCHTFGGSQSFFASRETQSQREAGITRTATTTSRVRPIVG